MINSKSNLAAAISLALVFSGGISYSNTSSAQEEDLGLLEEVMVTASRREEAVQDVALAISVIDMQNFTDAGLSSLTDILPFVPGVSVQNDGAAFGNDVYIRGINAVGAGGVATYFDEIPFGSSTVYASGGAPLDGTLLDLGTLDVMKGPQGTLYGASAMGGLLKFNTRQASLEEWTGSLSADMSATNGGGLNQLYRVNANGPIVTDTLGMSFTAFWKDKEGYIDNVVLPKEGWDDYEYYGGSGSLYWQATEKLSINFQGLYQKSTQEGLATIQANATDGFMMPGLSAGQPWYGKYETGEADINPSEFEAQMLGMTINYEFAFATLTSVTSTQESSFNQTADLTVPFASFADLFFPENAPHDSALFVGDLGFDKFTQELRLVSPSNQRFEWIVGAFYADEESYNIQNLVTKPVQSDLFFANFPSNYKELSGYATGTFYFTPAFDASAGIRYADYSNDVLLEAKGPLVAPIPKTSIDDTVTNYLFNVRYRAGDNMSFYGRAASGYRPGGANFVLLDPTTGEPITDAFYTPDSLWSYELGMKGKSDSGRFGYELAAFYIDWQDYQISVVRGGLTVNGNAQKASSKGAEAGLSWALTDALTLTGTVSYIDAQLETDEPDLGGSKGTQLPNSPKWSGAVDLDYRFNAGRFPAFAGAAWRYKGEMPVGFEGYTDADGMFWPASSPRYDISAYSLVDLRAGISIEKVDLSFYLTNLFDEWSYQGFSTSFSSPSLGVPTRPRTIGTVVRWNFW